MQGLGLGFSEESIRKLRQQFDSLIKELNAKGQVNINIDSVNKEIGRIKAELNNLLVNKPINLKINTAQVENDLQKTVSTIDEAVKHYEQLGKVTPSRRIYDENGNLKKFIIDLERTEGLIERINYEGSSFQALNNGDTKAIGFSPTSIVEIDKVAQAEEKAQQKIQDAISKTIQKREQEEKLLEEKQSSAINKNLEQEYNENLKLADSIGKIREQSELRSKEDSRKNEIEQSKAINKALEDEYSENLKLAEAMAKAREQAELRRKEEEKTSEINQSKVSNKALDDQYQAQLKEQQRVANLGEVKSTFDPSLLQQSNEEIKKYVQNLYGADAKIVSFKKSVDGVNNSIIKMTVNTKNNKNEIQQEKVVIDQATNSVYKQEEAVKANTARMVSFSERLKNAFVAVTSFATVTTGFYAIVRGVKDGVNEIISLDTAMVDLKKVTDETDDAYRNFIDTANEMAIAVGHSTTSAIEATTYFARLGYTLQQAGDLAKNALIFSNIGDMDISSASENLIAIMKGYKLSIEDVTRVMDVANEVGNKYSISTSGIAEALKRSSSSLSVANNSLEESVGLIVAANNAVQDPEKVGNALKTLSMRLRGVSEDTGELIPKLREAVKTVTGVDIMKDENTFKSTYESMLEISKVYDTLSDKNKAYISEILAGKQQGNVFASIMQNMQEGAKAYDTAMGSMGSSTREQERYMQSIGAKINTLKETMVGFWKDSINSNTIKGVIDILTGLLKTFDNLGKVVTLAGGVLLIFNRKAIAELIVSIPRIAIGLKNAVVGLFSFTTATNGASLAMSNFQRVLGIIGVVLTVVSIAYSAFANAHEEAAQKAEEMKQKLQEEAQGLQDLKSQYTDIIKSGDLTETSKSQLKSIQDQLISSYNMEADALDLVNGKYEDQIKIINEASAKKAQEVLASMGSQGADAQKILSANEQTKFRDESGLTLWLQNQKAVNDKISSQLTVTGGGAFIVEGTLEERVNKLRTLINELDNMPVKNEYMKDFIQTLSDEFNKLNGELTTNQDTLSKYNQAKNTVDFYNQFKDQINQVNDLMIKLNKTTDTNEKAGIAKQIQDIKDNVNKTTSDSGKVEQYKNAINDLFSNITDGSNSASDGLNNFGDATGDASDSLNDFLTKNKDLNDSLKSLNQIIADQNNEQGMSADQIVDLISKYPELSKSIINTANGYMIQKDSLETLRQAKIAEMNTTLDAQANNAKATLQSAQSQLSAFGIIIEGIKTLQDAQVAASKVSTTYQLIQSGLPPMLAAKQQAENDALRSQIIDYGNLLNRINTLKGLASSPSYGVSNYYSSNNKSSEDAAKKAEEARNAMKQNVSDVEQAITDIIKKEFDKRKQAVEDEYNARKTALQKEKDLYDKQSEDDIYQKNLKKEQETLNGINSQIVNAQRDSSLQGQSRLRDLLSQAKEQQDKIDQMILDHTKQANDERFDQEIQNLDTQKQTALDALNNQFSDENISKMVNKALVTGQLDSLGSVLDAYKNFQNTYNDGLTASGQLLQTQFIDKWEQIQKLINGTSGISIGVDIKSLPVPSYDVGTSYIPNDQYAKVHAGEAILPKAYNIFTQNGLRNFINLVKPINVPSINKGTTPAINFNEPLISIAGGINSEIDLNKVIDTATEKVTSRIKSVLTDGAVYSH